MHALIIDDSMAIRKLIQGILLSDCGFDSVTQKENGLLGLQELEASCFGYDLIILDWYMPVMDGIDALMAIREKNRAIPVIICTSAGDKESIINAITAGANEYLIKPFDAQTLQCKTKKVIDSYQAQLKKDKYKRVLVVDDSVVIRNTIKKAILSDSIIDEVIIAGDGVEALELFNMHKIDLVVLDWEMPRKSGIEVLEEIRKHDTQTPIIMATGISEPDNMVAAFDAGASNFIPKPFVPHELLEKIYQLLFSVENKTNKRHATSDVGGFNIDSIKQKPEIEAKSELKPLVISPEGFMGFLEGQWRAAYRSSAPIGLALFSIDAFDLYLSTYDERQAEESVQMIIETIKTYLTYPQSALFRINKKTFACVISAPSYGEFQLKIAELVGVVSKLNLVFPESEIEPYITVSAGAYFGVPRSLDGRLAFLHESEGKLARAEMTGNHFIISAAR